MWLSGSSGLLGVPELGHACIDMAEWWEYKLIMVQDLFIYPSEISGQAFPGDTVFSLVSVPLRASQLAFHISYSVICWSPKPQAGTATKHLPSNMTWCIRISCGWRWKDYSILNIYLLCNAKVLSIYNQSWLPEKSLSTINSILNAIKYL